MARTSQCHVDSILHLVKDVSLVWMSKRIYEPVWSKSFAVQPSVAKLPTARKPIWRALAGLKVFFANPSKEFHLSGLLLNQQSNTPKLVQHCLDLWWTLMNIDEHWWKRNVKLRRVQALQECKDSEETWNRDQRSEEENSSSPSATLYTSINIIVIYQIIYILMIIYHII